MSKKYLLVFSVLFSALFFIQATLSEAIGISFPTATGNGDVLATMPSNPLCRYGVPTALFVQPNMPVPPEGFPEAVSVSTIPQADNYSYPFGLVAFTINCTPTGTAVVTPSVGVAVSTTVTLTFTGTSDLSGYQYRKFGKTPDNQTDHWYDFTYDGTTGAEISGNTVTLHFVDGQRGDDDLLQNGVIVDQGGPGRLVQAASVPAMNTWGLITFVMLAGIGSAYFLRKRELISRSGK